MLTIRVIRRQFVHKEIVRLSPQKKKKIASKKVKNAESFVRTEYLSFVRDFQLNEGALT